MIKSRFLLLPLLVLLFFSCDDTTENGTTDTTTEESLSTMEVYTAWIVTDYVKVNGITAHYSDTTLQGMSTDEDSSYQLTITLDSYALSDECDLVNSLSDTFDADYSTISGTIFVASTYVDYDVTLSGNGPVSSLGLTLDGYSLSSEQEVRVNGETLIYDLINISY